MQPIDPHTLFSIFEQGDEEIYKEHGMEDALKNPFVLMGMVVKGIENYFIMDQMYIRRYANKYKNVRNITKLKYFDNLYGYLNRIDSDNFEDMYKIGESFSSSDTHNALDYMRLFYEKLEHYEKCAIVKRYIDLLIKQESKQLV